MRRRHHSAAVTFVGSCLGACLITFGAMIQGAHGAAIKGTAGSVAGSTGSVAGLAGTLGLTATFAVECPANSWVSGLQGFKPNGQDQIVQIRYSCRTLSSPLTAFTAITGTDISVAGSTGSVAGLAGTIGLPDTATVQCPRNSLVSGLQGFKPNGQNPIVQIRYSCKYIGSAPTTFTAIRGTDTSVAGSTGSVSGLAGTIGLPDTATVQCPRNSLVSGLQGFKPNGQDQIIEIRYLCR
jgi:hypothetical protein